jgi:hypothetical protein
VLLSTVTFSSDRRGLDVAYLFAPHRAYEGTRGARPPDPTQILHQIGLAVIRDVVKNGS